MTTSHIQRAVFYGRYSTSKQDMQMQIDAADRFCKERGYELVDTKSYRDDGVSATKTGFRARKGLMKLLSEIDSGKFDLVVAYSDNRIARDPVEHAQIRLLLHGVKVFLCDSGRLYNPEDGDLLSQVINDGASKFEVDQTRERTRDTFISKVGRGERIGGKLPYGVIHDKRTDKYVVDSRYQGTLRHVFEMYSQGYGFHAIAKRLSWLKSDGKPNKEKVKAIIINPFYAGYVSMYKVKRKSRLSVQDMSEWIMEKSTLIEPLISYELWLECFRLYKRKKERDKQATSRSTETPFLLGGLLYCVHHEPPVLMKAKNRIKVTRTSLGMHQKYGAGIYHCEQCEYAVDAQALHHKILQTIMTTISPSNNQWENIKEQLFKRMQSEADEIQSTIENLQSDIEMNRRLVDKATRKLESLVPKTETHLQSMRILEAYRTVLSQKTNECQVKQRELRKQLEHMEQLRERDIQSIRYNSFTESQLRRLVTSLIQTILIDSSGNIVDTQARVDMDI